MASPAPSEANNEKGQEQIMFRFCRECSNMLYPREDKYSSILQFACRTCSYTEPAPGSCVFRNNLYNTVGETAGVTQDVGSDPTVGTQNFFTLEPDCTCTHCGQPIVCFFCGETDELLGEVTNLEKIEGEARRVSTPSITSKRFSTGSRQIDEDYDLDEEGDMEMKDA